MRFPLTFSSLTAAFLLLAHPTSAAAQSRQFAYTGHLDLDGAPVTGAHDFRFALFATETADARCMALSAPDACDAESLWWDQYPAIAVSGGAFSVTLGAKKALGDAVLASPELWVAIAVREDASAQFTLLSGKQRVLDVPFAAAAKNYSVYGDLVVGGDAAIAGQATAGSLSAGSISVGAANAERLDADPSGLTFRNAQGQATATLHPTGAIAYGPEQLLGYRLVAHDDFESGAQDWRREVSGTATTMACLGANNHVLGGNTSTTNSPLSKTYSLPEPHTEAMVQLTFIAIDSWDSEWAFVDVGTAAGTATMHCWRQQVAFSDPWVTLANFCGAYVPDTIYTVTCKVPHQTDQLYVRARVNVDGPPPDESFALDNVEIWVR